MNFLVINQKIKKLLKLFNSSRQFPLGGIELVTSSKICGWVGDPKEKFSHVILFIGDNIIASSDISEKRTDVSSLHNCQDKPGFSIVLPTVLPPLDWSRDPEIFAYYSNSTRKTKLTLVKGNSDAGKILREVLNSPSLGKEGHIDEYSSENLIYGWVGHKSQKKPSTFWIQSEGMAPLSFLADKYRSDMRNYGMPDNTGFCIDVKELPKNWANKKVFFSFDQEGLFIIPQTAEIIIPDVKYIGKKCSIDFNIETDITNLVYNLYSSNIDNNLQKHTRLISKFTDYLDQIDRFLTNIESNNIG